MFRNSVVQEFDTMSSKRVSGLALAAGLMVGIAGTARADESRHALTRLAGITTDLGNDTSALTYWVDEADGVHVVTTVDTVVSGEAAPDPKRHAIVRFSALILPGQSQEISVPGPLGSQEQALRIRRLGNQSGDFRIEVNRISPAQV